MAALALWIAIAVALFSVLSAIGQEHDIGHLQKRVACLEHPHGESSVFAVRGADGKLHVSKPTRTGC